MTTTHHDPAKLRHDLLWIVVGVATHLLIVAVVDARWGFETLLPAHDAGFYRHQLSDPWLIETLPDWWDNVPYRAVRIGFIALALPFRWLGTIPALSIANLIGLSAGIVVVRRVAVSHGANARLAAAAWILNPGAIVCTVLLLPDTIAWAAVLLAVRSLQSSRMMWSLGFGVAATATKEASLASLALVAVAGVRDGWRAAVPFSAGFGWHIAFLSYWIVRFGPSFHSTFVALPFLGWYEAMQRNWDARRVSLIAAICVLAMAALVVASWWRDRRCLYLAAATGQAVLMLGLDSVVIIPLSNSLRVGGLFLPVLAMCAVGNTDRESVKHEESLGAFKCDRELEVRSIK